MSRRPFLAGLLVACAFASAADAAVRLRVGNYAPLSSNANDTRVTVRVDGATLATLAYGEVRDYVELGGTASYRVQVVLPNGVVARDDNLVLEDGRNYTILALGNNQNQAFGYLITQDTTTAPPTGTGWLRYIHTASNNAPISVRLQNGTVVTGLENIPFGTPSPYVAGNAGTYDLRVTSTDGATTFADPPAFALAAGGRSEFVFAGDGVRQPYAVFPLQATTGGGVVDRGVNGAWTTGTATAQGMTLFPIPADRRLVGSWYTYTTTGALQWYTLESGANGFDGRTATLQVLAFSGPTFLGAQAASSRVAGSMTITFSSCSAATATYNVDGQSGTFTMTNLLPPETCSIAP